MRCFIILILCFLSLSTPNMAYDEIENNDPPNLHIILNFSSTFINWYLEKVINLNLNNSENDDDKIKEYTKLKKNFEKALHLKKEAQELPPYEQR